MRKQLLAALKAQGLAPNDQQAMRLAYGYCQPFDVAAKACGIPVGSFNVRVRRARRILGGASTYPWRRAPQCPRVASHCRCR